VFDELRQAMVRAPVLALPNATDPFILDTDASGFPPGILDKASAFACFFPGRCCTMYFHVELAQFFEPSGQLPLWLLKIHRPGETVMICPDREMPPQQVMPKLSREPNNC
jgi:hypothetical protein